MNFGQKALLFVAAACVLAGLSSAGQRGESAVAAVTNASEEDLLAQPPGANWTSYNGDYSGRRYSSLREINAANVAQLRASWVFHPGNSQRIEATPVVVRGIMYITSANDAFALDARTGRMLWHYERPVSSGLLDDAAGHKSRGVAVWRNSVYMETDDAHLLCLDARSGGLRWDVAYADDTLHPDEDLLIRRIAGLVSVGDRDRVVARNRAQARHSEERPSGV